MDSRQFQSSTSSAVLRLRRLYLATTAWTLALLLGLLWMGPPCPRQTVFAQSPEATEGSPEAEDAGASEPSESGETADGEVGELPPSEVWGEDLPPEEPSEKPENETVDDGGVIQDDGDIVIVAPSSGDEAAETSETDPGFTDREAPPGDAGEVHAAEESQEQPLPLGEGFQEEAASEETAGISSITVSAIVFIDRNGDGLPNEGDSVLAGAVVWLELDPCGPYPLEQTSALTDESGRCRFEVSIAGGEGAPGSLPSSPCGGRLFVDLAQGAASGYEATTPSAHEVVLGAELSANPVFFGVRLPLANAEMRMERVSAVSQQCLEMPVLLTTIDPVQGFVTAVRHDPRLRLQTISVDGTVTAEQGADFTSFDILPSGGTAGVVMDLAAPFLGNTIPPGERMPIVKYVYCCPKLSQGDPAVELSLEFVDGVLGDPPKENVIVVGGRSLSPLPVPGAIVCSPGIAPGEVTFLVGGMLDASGRPAELRGAAGETLELSFYYHLPLEGVGDLSKQGIQGLSMGLSHDCQIEVLEASFRLPPSSIALAVGTEYVNFQADNTGADGDGCEMVLGLLVDSQPPFQDKVLPAGPTPQLIAAVDIRLAKTALCNQHLPIEFADGVNGRGKVPVRNLFASGNQSFAAAKRGTRVLVLAEPAFKRGDCNGDGKVNTTDAAVTIMFLFPFWSGYVYPDCLDACDSNDSGKIEITDAVHTMRWLFQGGAPPPPPGVERPGPDPTPDTLGCERRVCAR